MTSQFDHIEVHYADATLARDPAIQKLYLCGVSTPFQTMAWFQDWERCVGKTPSSKSIDIVGYKNDIPVILLPLNLEIHLGYKMLSWRTGELSDYCCPLIAPEVREKLQYSEVQELIIKANNQYKIADVVKLQKLPEKFIVPNDFYSGSNPIRYHVYSHRTIVKGSWDEYYNAKRGPKTRRRLKDKFKTLSKFAPVTMRFAENEEEARELIAQCISMKASQLKRRNNWNPFSSTSSKQHVIDHFSSGIGDNSWVASLYLGEKPIAISFGFKSSEGWLLYQLAMQDGDHAAYSPGTHLLIFIMRHCWEAGAKMFDFSLGDEPYKDDWCEVHDTLLIDVFSLSWRGMPISALLRLAAHIRLKLSSYPNLMKHFRVLKNKTKLA